MALKKHKIIALATSTVALSSTLVTSSAIAFSHLIQAANEAKARKASLHIAADENFKWDSTGKIILGFKAGVDIDSLIDDSGYLSLPEKCEEIGEGAFDFAFQDITHEFVKIKFPVGLKVIGAKAFYDNPKITGYESYGTGTWALTTIGKCAFDGCSGLTKAIIPATCNSIGERAFYECTSLAEIDLQTRTKLIDNVGSHAFQTIAETGTLTAESMSGETANAIAANLSTVEQGEVNFQAAANEGWTINSGSTALTKTVPPIYLNIDENNKLKAGLKRGNIDNYKALFIPQEVVEIGNNAFINNTNLTSLAWEDQSKCATIGQRAFYGCTKICQDNATEGKLTLPAAVTNIGWQAFYGCSGIQSIDLSKIEFGNRARTFAVGTEAFAELHEFEDVDDRVTFPTPQSGGMSATEIRQVFSNALLNTGGLSDKYIDTGVVAIDAEYVSEHTSMSQIQIEGDENYYYSINGFEWPTETGTTYNALVFDTDESVIAVADGAFWDEDNKTTTIPESITKIDMSNTSIKEIGDNAFRGAKSLTTVAFSDDTETIGANAFEDCTNLEGITLPSSLQTIGASAFQGCDNAYYLDFSQLTNAQLQDIITRQNNGENAIGDQAFKDFGVMKATGGTIIWPSDITESVKTGIIDILIAAGLPSTWVREETSKEGYTGGIPVSYNDNTILEIVEDEVAGTAILTSINWTNLDAYIAELESTTGVAVTSLSLIIPKYVTSIAENFWGNPTSANLSKIDKLSFAANSKCTTIGANAFYSTTASATNFTGSLTLPDTITTVGDSAFKGCTGFDGTLKLPKSITVSTTAGLGQYAFEGTNFSVVNVEKWDSDYINTWDVSGGSIPVGTSSFENIPSSVTIVANDMIDSDQLTILKTVLDTPGKLPVTSFGTDITAYTSTVPAADISSIITAHPELKTVDDDTKKEIVLDTYIDWINDGLTISGTTYTGSQILKNDLMLTLKAAAINSPELAASKQQIFVNLTDVEAHGPSINFNITVNLNVWSDTYQMGYVVQFSTKVENLKLVSVCDYATTDINQTIKQVGVKFTTSQDTVFTTAYDKQYVYSYDENQSQLKKTVVDTTNTSYSMHDLESEYRDAPAIVSTEAAANRLHTLTRNEFLAAPSLFGAIFGAYDYADLYNLNNGCDENGILYTPYMSTEVTENATTTYKYKPLDGAIKSVVLSKFNIYSTDLTDSRFPGATIWQNNVQNFEDQLDQHAAATLTIDEIISTYGQYLNETSGSFNPELGQRFREDMLFSTIHALQGMVDTSIYTHIEESSIKFVKLADTPVIKYENGNYILNFGMISDFYLHDDSWISNGYDTSGNQISGYEHSLDAHVPIAVRNVVLNGAYKSDVVDTIGCYWSIFNNDSAIVEDSGFETFQTTLVDGTKVGPYMRILSYDSTTEKFTNYTVVEAIKNNKFADVWNAIQGKSQAEVEAYAKSTWPLLYRLQFIDIDNDGSATHISLRHNTMYLKKITIKN